MEGEGRRLTWGDGEMGVAFEGLRGKMPVP